MTQADQIIADKILENSLRLERFTASERKKVLAMIEQLQKDLKAKLNNDLTDFGKARVNKLLKESTEIIEAAYKGVVPVTKAETVFHGGDLITEIKLGKSKYGKVFFVSDDPTYAKSYGGNKSVLNTFEIKTNAKLLDTRTLDDATFNKIKAIVDKRMPIYEKGIKVRDAIGKEISFGTFSKSKVLQGLKNGEAFYAEQPALIKIYKELGYDGFISAESKFGRNIGVLNTDILELKPPASQSTDLLGLARHEAAATARTFAAIGLTAKLPTDAVLRALSSDTLLFGAPLKDWWAKQSDDLAFRYANSIRQGVVAGETLQQMIVRVFGSKKLGTPGIGFPDSVLRRNASALVHDSIMKVSGEARMEVYKANDDIIKGYYQLSTLDSKTSPVCMAYSGAEWDLEFKPIGGNKLPFNNGTPRHVNCRSLTLPIMKTFKELGLSGVSEMPKGTRASDEGQVPADTTFAGFLSRKSVAEQNEMLGAGRADLWRKGTITLSQLLDFKGNPLTLTQLTAKYKS